MMNKFILSTQPYKGTQDAYPEDMLIRNYIFETWTRIAKQFGYEEYDTPLIEEINLYKAKSGEEIANTQLYSFTDKGGREIALRPEMTPSLARMIAAKINVIPQPIRWFNIGKYYRYEKPQKGRTREFIQLNIDVFGISSLEAELEIIQYVMAVMDSFNAPKDTYELRINNRYLLDYLLEDTLKLDKSEKQAVGRAIDNYSKMTEKDFYNYLSEVGLDNSQSDKVKEYLNWTLEDLEDLKSSSKGAAQLIELFKKAEELGITNIKFDPSIMRGFLYYTGTVIEMFDIGSKENPRALFGGGRYDDLLEIFNKEKLPAFGLGWGNVTMENYLRTYNLLPSFKTNTQIFVPLLDESLYTKTNQLAQELRKAGFNVELQAEPTKLKKQFKYADKKNIPLVLILGEDEIEKNTVQVKNMQTGESFVDSIPSAIEKIKAGL